MSLSAVGETGFDPVTVAYQQEVVELKARLFAAEARLAEHGIAPPTEALEHLAACRNVVIAAYELLPHLATLTRLVGSGTELLQEERWRT